MYCTKCGKQAAPGDAYCAACGTALRTEENLVLRRKLRLLTLMLACVIVIAGGAILLRKPAQSAPVQPELAVPETEQSISVPEAPAQTQTAVPAPPEPVPTAPTSSGLYLSEETVRENGTLGENVYRYDSQGRIAWKQTEYGYVHTYSYRSDGSLEKEGISFGGEPTTVILYDAQSNPVQESNLEGYIKETENTYDNRKRLISSQTRTDSQGLLEESYYTYHDDGSYTLDYIDHAEGMLHCHRFTAFDARGRILTQSQDLESGMPVTVLTENTYDIFGNPERTEYTYDDGEYRISRLTEYINTCNGDGLLEQAQVYVTERQTIRGETTEVPRKLEKTVLYTYDQNHRLIQKEERGADNGWSYTCSWEYDAHGNLLRYEEGDGDLIRTCEYAPLEQLQYS